MRISDLPANPVWEALHTKHRHFAAVAGDACRYPADVAPLAAVAAPTVEALGQLSTLLAPGESLWIAGEIFPNVAGLLFEGTLRCLQMVLPDDVAPPTPNIDIVRLSCADAAEMVALTDAAFPGFFRPSTCAMGSYYGVRREGQLIAMGGERIMLDGYAEVSGVCTLPEHRGQGLAASLIWQLVRDHRRNGVVSWLHVRSDNPAAELYRRMGFQVVREITLHRVRLVLPRLSAT